MKNRTVDKPKTAVALESLDWKPAPRKPKNSYLMRVHNEQEISHWTRLEQSSPRSLQDVIKGARASAVLKIV